MINKIKILILSILLVTALLPSIAIAQEDKFYQLDLSYDKGTIQLKNVAVLAGSISRAAQEGDYGIELVSFSDTILYKSAFGIQTSTHIDGYDPTGGTFTSKIVQSDTLDFTLNIPYFSNGKTINIYNPDHVKALGVDVGYFAQTCGDKVCEPHESYNSCPADCPPVGKMIPQKIKGMGQNLYLIAGIAVVVFGSAAFAYWRMKRRRKLMGGL